jgi:transposase-like protein
MLTALSEAKSRMICPQCRSADCFRSHRGGVLDFLGTIVSLRPWRCHTCDFRFYAWRVAVSFAGYAHCPRCGNFDLEHISRERVGRDVRTFLQRRLGFPAYRCDPCREKFFSVRPHRRILPSMVSTSEDKAVHS